MLVRINKAVREYHIAFRQDRSKRFEKGPNAGKPQTVTDCKIWLLGGERPQFIGGGVTVLGSKDKADSVEAFKFALSRALDDAKLGKEANTLFWKEFHKRHRRPLVCQHKVMAKGSGTDWCTERSRECRQERCGGPVHGYGGLYSHQRQAMSNVVRGVAGEVEGKEIFVPWSKGEIVLPRCKAEKYRKQAGSRCHRRGDSITIVNTVSHADQLRKILHNNSKQIRDILGAEKKRQWLRGTWAVADERLTARMKSLSLLAAEEFARVDAELLSRPGITKVHDAYIVGKDFLPRFKAGDIVTWEEDAGLAKVLGVKNVILTIQPVTRCFGHVTNLGPARDVMDWEVKPVLTHCWLRRVWKWLEDTTACDARTVPEKDHGSELWEKIQANYCVACHQVGDFLKDPRGRSQLNIKCVRCGQKYWADPDTKTAKKI